MSIEVEYIPSEWVCWFLVPQEGSMFSKIQVWEWRPTSLTQAVEHIEEFRHAVKQG